MLKKNYSTDKFSIFLIIVGFLSLIPIVIISQILRKKVGSLKESKEYQDHKKDLTTTYNLTIATTILAGLPLVIIYVLTAGTGKGYYHGNLNF
jgi:hypothetical protein